MVAMVLNILTLLVLIANAGGSPGFETTQKFDEFGDIKCEDEMARLDNVALQLQNEPASKAVLVYFGGTTFRGKLPRRRDAAARAARLKPYLVERRGIPFNRVMVFDGGYAKEWHVEVWIVPLDFWFPPPHPVVPDDGVTFREGRVSPRDYRCGV